MKFKNLILFVMLIGMFQLTNADEVNAYTVPHPLISEDGAFKPNAVVGCLDYMDTDILIYLWDSPDRNHIVASLQNFTTVRILSILEDYRARKFTGKVCVLVIDVFGHKGWIGIIQVYSIYKTEGEQDGKTGVKSIRTGSDV